jgi:hypothetical protein
MFLLDFKCDCHCFLRQTSPLLIIAVVQQRVPQDCRAENRTRDLPSTKQSHQKPNPASPQLIYAAILSVCMNIDAMDGET